MVINTQKSSLPKFSLYYFTITYALEAVYYYCICMVCVCTQSVNHVWLFCDLVDCSLQGSSVHWILQARILEWVSISSSRGSSQPSDQTCVSCMVISFQLHRQGHRDSLKSATVGIFTPRTLANATDQSFYFSLQGGSCLFTSTPWVYMALCSSMDLCRKELSPPFQYWAFSCQL